MEFKRICKALYKYEAIEEGELSFEEDELLYILDDENEDWWKASLEMNPNEDPSRTGLIPYNYVEDIDYIAKYIALYDYEAQGDDELSFQESMEILVYQIEGEDWMLAFIDGKFGFVPQNYCEEVIEDHKEANEIEETNYEEDEFYDAVETELEPKSYSEAESNLPPHGSESFDRQPSSPNPNPNPLSTKKIAKDDMLFWRVSEVDKKKKKKKRVKLGISSDLICIASEEEKGAPVRKWSIAELTTYSLKNKHIILNIQSRESIMIDFSCTSIKQAEAIAYKIRSCSEAVYKEKLDDKNSKGFFSMFKKKSKAPALQAEPSSGRRQDIKEKYESVPLPPLPADEIEKASIQQRQYYPETKTQIRSPITSTPSRSTSIRTNLKGKPALVIYDFEAAEAEELSVSADTRVYVVESEPGSEWWKCRLYKDDEAFDEGFVPAEYLSLLPDEVTQVSSADNLESSSGGPNPSQVREWTDATGSFKVEAEFLKYEDGKIHLHKVNGVKIAVQLEKMSKTDVDFVSMFIGQDLTSDLDSAKKQSAEKDKWVNFFKACEIVEADAQKYATTFTKEKFDRSLLASIDRETLKGLGMAEGDIIRVLKASKTNTINKAPKSKRSVTFSPTTTIIDSSKDEELAYKLQQEEIERMRKEQGKNSMLEVQIEQDEMLARKLQAQDYGDDWEGFSSVTDSEHKKYGLGLSGGLKKDKGSKSGSIDTKKLAEASALFQKDNEKDSQPNKGTESKSSKEKASSDKAKNSGYDEDIWGVPGARATYQKKAPIVVQEEASQNPTQPIASPTSSNKTKIPGQPELDPWAVFPSSPSKPQEKHEKPIFSSDKVRQNSRSKNSSAIDQNWSSVSQNFMKANNSSDNVRKIDTPKLVSKSHDDLDIFTKIQQPQKPAPNTVKQAPPNLQQTQQQSLFQPQFPPIKPNIQTPTYKTPVVLSQPLVPVPNNSSQSNVFIPTRRPAPPKPKTNLDVFSDLGIVKKTESPSLSAKNNTFGSTSPSTSSNTENNTNVSNKIQRNDMPDVFGAKEVPIAKLAGATTYESPKANNMGFSANILSKSDDISITSYKASSTTLNSVMGSPVLTERSFAPNQAHDMTFSSLDTSTNYRSSTIDAFPTALTNRSIQTTSRSISTNAFDDLSLKALGLNSKKVESSQDTLSSTIPNQYHQTHSSNLLNDKALANTITNPTLNSQNNLSSASITSQISLETRFQNIGLNENRGSNSSLYSSNQLDSGFTNSLKQTNNAINSSLNHSGNSGLVNSGLNQSGSYSLNNNNLSQGNQSFTTLDPGLSNHPYTISDKNYTGLNDSRSNMNQLQTSGLNNSLNQSNQLSQFNNNNNLGLNNYSNTLTNNNSLNHNNYSDLLTNNFNPGLSGTASMSNISNSSSFSSLGMQHSFNSNSLNSLSNNYNNLSGSQLNLSNAQFNSNLNTSQSYNNLSSNNLLGNSNPIGRNDLSSLSYSNGLSNSTGNLPSLNSHNNLGNYHGSTGNLTKLDSSSSSYGQSLNLTGNITSISNNQYSYNISNNTTSNISSSGNLGPNPHLGFSNQNSNLNSTNFNTQYQLQNNLNLNPGPQAQFSSLSSNLGGLNSNSNFNMNSNLGMSSNTLNQGYNGPPYNQGYSNNNEYINNRGINNTSQFQSSNSLGYGHSQDKNYLGNNNLSMNPGTGGYRSGY